MKAVSCLLLLGLWMGCGERPAGPEGQQVSAPEFEAGAEKPVVAKTPRDDYEERVEAILNQYLERAEKLRASARDRDPTTNETIRPALEALEANATAVALILETLKSASSESWSDLKADVHTALDSLEISYDRTVASLHDATEEPLSPRNGEAEPNKRIREVAAERR